MLCGVSVEWFPLLYLLQSCAFCIAVSMEELKSAMEEHVELVADLVQKISSELRTGLRPAYDNFIGFFHAIDWKVPLPLQLCVPFSFLSFTPFLSAW